MASTAASAPKGQRENQGIDLYQTDLQAIVGCSQKMTFAFIKGVDLFTWLRVSKWTLRAPRLMMLALVFMAAGFVSLRPICELTFAKYGHVQEAALTSVAGHATTAQPNSGDMPSAFCCVNVKDGTLVNPAEPVASWTQGGLHGSVLFVFASLLLFAQLRYPASRILAAPPERSFYARSARVLR